LASIRSACPNAAHYLRLRQVDQVLCQQQIEVRLRHANDQIQLGACKCRPCVVRLHPAQPEPTDGFGVVNRLAQLQYLRTAGVVKILIDRFTRDGRHVPITFGLRPCYRSRHLGQQLGPADRLGLQTGIPLVSCSKEFRLVVTRRLPRFDQGERLGVERRQHAKQDRQRRPDARALREALIYSALPVRGRMPRRESSTKCLIHEARRGRVPRRGELKNATDGIFQRFLRPQAAAIAAGQDSHRSVSADCIRSRSGLNR
jgi:hypothetical protein